MKPELLLIGGGGHCHSCIEVIESTGQFQIKGIVGLPNEVGQSILGYEILGCDDDLPNLIKRCPQAIVAAGQIKSADVRIRLYERLIELEAELPRIVASTAVISRHAQLGAGTIVMHGAIVNAGATVGVNGIVNSMALIEHDAVVGDHSHVSTAAVLNGGVTVGNKTFIGSCCVVLQNIRVGEHCVIGSGAIISSDVASDSTVRGARHEWTKTSI